MQDPVQKLGRIGMNVTRDGSDDLAAIRSAGFDTIRIPVTIADLGPPQVRVDLRAYLGQARVLGLKVLLVLDRDAYYWPDWRRETSRYVAFWADFYAGLFDGIQAGNEPDHISPSSWDLAPTDFSALLAATRAALGPGVYLVAGGLASGQPDYLDQVDLSVCDAYAAHPYTKSGPSIDALYHQYEVKSTLPLLTTEWGCPSAWGPDVQADQTGETIAWAGRHGTPLWVYNWKDGGETFGLLDGQGRPKRALAAATAAIAALPVIGDVPPSPVPPGVTPAAAGTEAPAVDPWRWFGPTQLAQVVDAPEVNIRAHWPRIVAQLAVCGINTRGIQRAIIPTIAIETGGPDRSRRFTPVPEAYWTSDAWRRANLRYYPFFGRGFIQTTWRDNYAAADRAIAALWRMTTPLGLVENPDLALDPDVAAAALAIFWRDTRALPTPAYPNGYSLIDAAIEGDTEWLRRLVQGGTAGLTPFRAMYALLGDAPGETPAAPPRVSFNRAYPTILQDDPWSCWPTSARWLLGAIGADADGDGQPPTEAYVEGQAIRDGIVSKALGLLVASAGPGARWLNEQWLDALGLHATAYGQVSYADLIRMALEGPVLAGWPSHWTAIRGVSPEGELQLANPAPNWMGAGQRLSEAEFTALGPFTAIGVPVGEQEDPLVIAQLQAQLAQVTQERDAHKADRDRLITYLAVVGDDRMDAIAAVVDQVRQDRVDALGPRPVAGGAA